MSAEQNYSRRCLRQPPKSVAPGRFLMHNRVRHARGMSCGLNGFRAWTNDKLWPGFKRCRCGWVDLEHYSENPKYKCDPFEKIMSNYRER
jgi:hypothetical protein